MSWMKNIKVHSIEKNETNCKPKIFMLTAEQKHLHSVVPISNSRISNRSTNLKYMDLLHETN